MFVLAVRRYLALLRKRPRFVLGVVAVLAVAGACLVVAQTNAVFHVTDSHEALRELIRGFGDAFIIAIVLALLVDPMAQHQFATEWGRDLFWAIFSPHAPEKFRDALQALAAPLGYMDRCAYELTFSYPPDGSRDYYEIDWNISLEGVTLERRGFKISDPVFVVSRHDGTASKYVRWSFWGDGSAQIAYSEDELESLGAVSVDSSGRTQLDQSKLPGTGTVPFGKKYWSERHLKTSRWKADFLPLFQPRIVLEHSIVIKGGPIEELEFSITQLGRQPTPLASVTRPDGKPALECSLDEVAFPGQASLVSWKPKTADVPDAAKVIVIDEQVLRHAGEARPG